MTRAPTDDERALVAREIDGHYQDFVAIVAEGRGRTFDEIEPLARGRVWAGTAARDVGLVDRLGGFEDAVALVREALPGEILEAEPRMLTVRPPSRRVASKPEERAASVTAEVAGLVLSLLPRELRALVRSLVPFGLFALSARDGHAQALALATELPPLP
jgi:protease-4